ADGDGRRRDVHARKRRRHFVESGVRGALRDPVAARARGERRRGRAEGLRAELRAQIDALVAGKKVPIAETDRRRAGVEIEVEESLFLIPATAEKPARIASIARDIGEIARLRRAAELLGRVGSVPPEAGDEETSPAMREMLA